MAKIESKIIDKMIMNNFGLFLTNFNSEFNKKDSVSLVKVYPKAFQKSFSINKDCFLYFIQGDALIIINDDEVEVKAGDYFYIPSDSKHVIKNIGLVVLEYIMKN